MHPPDIYGYAEDGFRFLELNPRLRVERPTTEMVTGVNLPAAQLQVVVGPPLHHIRHIHQLYEVALMDTLQSISIWSNPKQTNPNENLVPRVTSSLSVSPPRIPMVSSNLLIFRSNTNV